MGKDLIVLDTWFVLILLILFLQKEKEKKPLLITNGALKFHKGESSTYIRKQDLMLFC